MLRLPAYHLSVCRPLDGFSYRGSNPPCLPNRGPTWLIWERGLFWWTVRNLSETCLRYRDVRFKNLRFLWSSGFKNGGIFPFCFYILWRLLFRHCCCPWASGMGGSLSWIPVPHLWHIFGATTLSFDPVLCCCHDMKILGLFTCSVLMRLT